MSIKVIIIKDKPIAQMVLNKDVTTIGRKSDCDISLKDPSVSGLHARIKVVGENYLLEDLDSTNGVGVLGRKIKQYTLKNDDLVTIGEHQLKFLIQASKVPDAAKAATTPKVAQATGSPATGEGPGAVKTPGIAKPVVGTKSAKPLLNVVVEGYLEVLNGPQSGTRIVLEDGLTTIGEPGIQMAAVSRRPQGHFIIHVDGGKDKDKVPLVNDEPTGFKSRKLESGDKIEIAGIRMEYHRK